MVRGAVSMDMIAEYILGEYGSHGKIRAIKGKYAQIGVIKPKYSQI